MHDMKSEGAVDRNVILVRCFEIGLAPRGIGLLQPRPNGRPAKAFGPVAGMAARIMQVPIFPNGQMGFDQFRNERRAANRRAKGKQIGQASANCIPLAVPDQAGRPPRGGGFGARCHHDAANFMIFVDDDPERLF